MSFANVCEGSDEGKLRHVRTNAVLRMLLLHPLELVPMLFQHGCFHLKSSCKIESNVLLCCTWSFLSLARAPQLIMLSRVMSAISSKLLAAMSRLTVPFKRRERSSKREWRERVATWGLLQRLPPSSTSSSNFTHLKRKIISRDVLAKIHFSMTLPSPSTPCCHPLQHRAPPSQRRLDDSHAPGPGSPGRGWTAPSGLAGSLGNGGNGEFVLSVDHQQSTYYVLQTAVWEKTKQEGMCLNKKGKKTYMDCWTRTGSFSSSSERLTLTLEHKS